MSVGAISKTAWETLLHAGVARLPVRPSQVARAYGLHIYTYTDYQHATGMDSSGLLEAYGADGFTQLARDQYAVFYNECNPPVRIRWTLAHELGHILLGHISPGSRAASRRESRDPADVQADNFAARLLCPEAVAHLCCVESVEELALLADLSLQAASIQWKSLCERRARGPFKMHELERLLASRFGGFIGRYRSERLCREPELMPPAGNLPAYRI